MKQPLSLIALVALTLAPCLCTAAPVVLPNGLSLVANQGAPGDICGIHIVLNVGPERVPAQKAGLRAITQQIILDRMRNKMKDDPTLTALREQGTQGAALSVDTEWDEVEFTASVTSDQLPKLLGFMAAAIFGAEWSQDDFVNAKEVVARQQLGESDAGAASYDALNLFRRALLGDSPLAQPIFGTEKTRDSITLDDLTAFYSTYYVPNLASVCIVSPLSDKTIAQIVRQACGEYKARKVAPAPAVKLGASSTRVETGLSPELDAAVLIVGVPLPSVGSDGYLMGQIMYAVLSGPNGALTSDKALAAQLSPPDRGTEKGPDPFGVLPVPQARAPYLAVFARVSPMSIEDARQALLSQLLRFGREPLSEDALHRAKLRAINLHANPMDQANAAATLLNRRLLFSTKDILEEDYADRVNAITAASLQSFAREQFARHAIGVLMPGT